MLVVGDDEEEESLQSREQEDLWAVPSTEKLCCRYVRSSKYLEGGQPMVSWRFAGHFLLITLAGIGTLIGGFI